MSMLGKFLIEKVFMEVTYWGRPINVPAWGNVLI